MADMNRNVLTADDINQAASAESPDQMPATLGDSPPGGIAVDGSGGAAAAPGPAGDETGDGYLTKLLKFVPPEVLGTYLLVETIVKDNVSDQGALAWWLGALLVAMLVLTVPYDMSVLRVVRLRQIAMSVVGLAVYVFATGGWFATTSWYQPFQATIALAVFGLLVQIVRLGPLPTASD